ncbi:MAG: ectoine/hydroxyectoine ABC transporter permease subunit EhuC [Propionibacteriales bacterium]|nr:ectoine/hydroxyectoine ABC transporter permease subunit EhuC [Propionibacteriales bacterium]
MSTVFEYRELFIQGLQATALLTVLGLLLTLVVAFTAGLARLSRHWVLRAPSYVFVEVFRGTSMIVQLFWFYYALPQLGLQLTPLFAGVLVLGLNEGAYAAEVVRGTIASRPRGQTEACIALGLSPAQRMRRVLIPQSIPAMLPSFGNVFVDLLKATSLVSFITVSELTFLALDVRNNTGETTAVFLTMLVIYFALAMAIAMLTLLLERRFAIDRKRRPSLRKALLGSGGGPVSA